MSTRSKVISVFGLATVLAFGPAGVSVAGPSCPGRAVNIPACPVPTTAAPTTIAPTTVAPTTVAPTTAAPSSAAPTTQAPATSAPASVAPPTVEAITETAPAPTELTVARVRAAQSALPSTGSSPVTVLTVSGLLLAAGVAIAVVTRRRAAS